MPPTNPQTKPKTITPKDAEAAASSAKATHRKRPQTKEATTLDPQQPRGRPRQAHNQSTPKMHHSPIHSSRPTAPSKIMS